ncbi:tRNA (guanine(10)-N(2))-dimethyltransferase [Candidatus Harpocratesius sp.]
MGSNKRLDSNLSITEEGGIRFYSYPSEEYSNGGKALLKSMPVFYNPVQEINRSITLIAYRVFQTLWKVKNEEKTLKILDTMAASGIRSLRLANYLEKPLSITANDINPLAIGIIKKNIELNNLPTKIQIENQDCIPLMTHYSSKREFFSIIDIDPFGTPNIFIQSAIRALEKRGLLGITATDTPVLFGVRPDACLRKYNVSSLRSTFSKEVGLRILLYYIAKNTHPWMKAIKPLLSLSFDHYIRVFVQIEKGKKAVQSNLKNIGYIVWCSNCDWRNKFSLNILEIPKKCPNCGCSLKFGGPLWIGDLHDDSFVLYCINQVEANSKDVIPSKSRIERTLKIVREENQFPLGYYDIHKICDNLQVSVPSMKTIEEKIISKGFQFSRTHIEPHAIKSDISIHGLEAILKEIHLKHIEN